MRTIIISDLHVGAGALDDCDVTLESHLCRFLRDGFSPTIPTELVINGDFLDFAQAPPWHGSELRSVSNKGTQLCFTEAQSVAKLENIFLAHPKIFDAIRHFLEGSPTRSVVIMPGNHDVDLFWPKVRKRFLTYLGPKCLPRRSTAIPP